MRSRVEMSEKGMEVEDDVGDKCERKGDRWKLMRGNK